MKAQNTTCQCLCGYCVGKGVGGGSTGDFLGGAARGTGPGRLPSPGVRRRTPPPSLPLLTVPQTAPQPIILCEERVCAGQECTRPLGCGGDGGTMSGGEATGTSLPVWQTLKGLSSREACHSPTSPSLRPSPLASTSVAERLARRGSCPPVASLAPTLTPGLVPALAPIITPAISPALTPCSPREVVPPKLIIPEGDGSGGLYNGSVASPTSATGEEGGGRAGWGPPSSSTTSTSLSNANLALQHHSNKHVVSNNSLSFAASPKEERDGDETPSVFR